MQNLRTWFIAFSGMALSHGMSVAMDIEDRMDVSPRPSTFPSSSVRIYNLQPSKGTTSYQVLKAQEDPHHLKAYFSMDLPEQHDFRAEIPYIHNQGHLGSCTAQAITLSMEYILKKTNPLAYRPLSPLFVYFNERDIEGTISYDAGAALSDGILSVCKQGACAESQWTYSDNRTKFKKRPPELAYKDARLTMDLDNMGQSHVPQDLTALKSILARDVPIVFGINVYSSFESPLVENTGNIPLPKRSERKLGEHAMTLVGYDDKARVFHLVNSWGEKWGNQGFGTIPYDYVLNPRLTYPDDFWKIESVGPKKSRRSVKYLIDQMEEPQEAPHSSDVIMNA